MLIQLIDLPKRKYYIGLAYNLYRIHMLISEYPLLSIIQCLTHDQFVVVSRCLTEFLVDGSSKNNLQIAFNHNQISRNFSN